MNEAHDIRKTENGAPVRWSAWLGAGVLLTRDEYERRCRIIEHRETASRLGIDDDALWEIKSKLAAAWEDGGGIQGALHRLKFANRILTRQAPNERGERLPPNKP